MRSRLQKRLDSIQRLFFLYITGAYRTTPTAALQVVTGLEPLHLQIHQEETYARVARARSSSNFFTLIFSPTDYESKSSGIHIHPHNFLLHNQTSFSENHRDSGAKVIYTDGSKTDVGIGSAYCILENYGIIASWQGKLDHSISVFQAEILAIKMAIEAPSSLHRPIKIWTDSNKCADQLAKEVITKGDPFFLPKSLSYLKSEIRSAALSIWQYIYYSYLTPCLRQRGHGQDWVRAADYTTTQRQHSHGNRPDVLGMPDPELANQGHAMSKHSRARSHHPLFVTDPRWATPTTTPLGQVNNATLPGGQTSSPTLLGLQELRPG
ncbi:hypothetical protein AVEN_93461-1 [Araneus ventricosus]|uniref:RNase H type-1 domain-containing protein n=1 Tax=Araneus ventricosus TaxID=182803 RepID=A0A4Y2AR60_ARAVE|nr:hypothetical protein AVEN_93461-1 [Araneus ventricosus]